MTSLHAQFLATHTVADVLSEKKQDHDLIDIQVTATVETVFETLLANGKNKHPCFPVQLPLFVRNGKTSSRQIIKLTLAKEDTMFTEVVAFQEYNTSVVVT